MNEQENADSLNKEAAKLESAAKELRLRAQKLSGPQVQVGAPVEPPKKPPAATGVKDDKFEKKKWLPHDICSSDTKTDSKPPEKRN